MSTTTSTPKTDEELRSEILAKVALQFCREELTKIKKLFSDEFTIRVSQIPESATEDDCNQFFLTFGRVKEAAPTQRRDVWLVEYETVFDAQSAVEAEDPMIRGESVAIMSLSTSQSRHGVLKAIKDDFFIEMRTVTVINFPFGMVPCPELSDFFTQFGPIESYTILPYTTQSSLVYVRFQQVSAARSMCALFTKSNSHPQQQQQQQQQQHSSITPQSQPIFKFKNRLLHTIPGRFKPTIFQHMYDIRPLVHISIPSRSNTVVFKYHDAQMITDLSIRQYLQSPLPCSFHFHLQRQNYINTCIATDNPSLYTTVRIRNLWGSENEQNNQNNQQNINYQNNQQNINYQNNINQQNIAPCLTSPSTILVPSHPYRCTEIAQDILTQCAKITVPIFNALHDDGSMYLRFLFPIEAVLCMNFFNQKKFNNCTLIAELLPLDEFTKLNQNNERDMMRG